jgi:hypothetical protein
LTAATTWSQNGRLQIRGYTNTYGDGGKATIRGPATGAAIVIATITGGYNWFQDLIFRRNGASSAAAIMTASGNRNIFYCCEFHDSRGVGASSSTAANLFMRCLATNNLGGGFSGTGMTVIQCVASGNTSFGFSAVTLIQCVAYANAGASTDGIINSGSVATMTGCISHGNGRHGFAINSTNSTYLVSNCIATNNGGFGYIGSATGTIVVLENCAARSNTSGSLSNTIFGESDYPGFLALTADPYVDAAAGDFNLNNTAGGGADLRAVNYAALGASDTTMYPFNFWTQPNLVENNTPAFASFG